MQKYLERSDINKLTSKRAGSKQGNRFNAPLYLAFMLGCAVSKSYSAILPIKSNREIPQEALSHTVKESYQSLFAAELGLDERNVNNDSMVKNIPSPITNGCTDEHLDASMERLVLLSHSGTQKIIKSLADSDAVLRIHLELLLAKYCRSPLIKSERLV